MPKKRNAPVTAAERDALRSVLAKHGTPAEHANPKIKDTVPIPRGKRHGDEFTHKGVHFRVVSFTRNGKRVRYATMVGRKDSRARIGRKSNPPVSIPKGKKKGDKFRAGNKTYQIISYTTKAGKRVRFARKV